MTVASDFMPDGGFIVKDKISPPILFRRLSEGSSPNVPICFFHAALFLSAAYRGEALRVAV